MDFDKQKFQSFALTLRPRNGVTDEQVKEVTAWNRKRSLHFHVITEKDGSARHIHAALILKTAVTRSNVLTVWQRLIKKFGLDTEELAVARKGVRVLYSNDFIDQYLNKGDDTEVIASELPEKAHLESYYPPKPEVKTKAAPRHSTGS